MKANAPRGVLFALLLAACGGGIDGAPDAGRTTALPDASDFQPGEPPDASEPMDPPDACASLSVEAQLVHEPVDIILAVDNSSSMKEEVTATNQNLNEFARIIEQSGLDYHVVMISRRGTHIDSYPFEICVPPPLAGPNCGDGPRYKTVNEEIYSTKVLKQIVRTYQGIAEKGGAKPELSWKGFLRPGSRKQFLAITDDNATATQMDDKAFDQQMQTLDPPTFHGYVFHAICGLDRATCPSIANVGQAYVNLARKTGGTTESICASDWKKVFQQLASAVADTTKIACEITLPPAPEGRTLRPSSVAVVYTPSDGRTPVTMHGLDSAGECASEPAFYFDDPASPTRIVLCPQTCPTIQADPGAKVDVMFGCDSILN